MSYHVLRLRTLMNRPERIDLTQPVALLDEEAPPAVLVLDEALAREALKSDAIAPYDLLAYWKAAARRPSAPLSALEGFFRETPVLLHGEAQRAARKALVPCYRRIEHALPQWLPAFGRDYFQAQSRLQPLHALELARGFLEAANRQIMAIDVGCAADLLPPLPNSLFTLFPRPDALQDYDAKLAALIQVLADLLGAQNRDRGDAWALVSVAVMGQEALLAALVYGLTHEAPQAPWTAEALMQESAPVSMLVGRRALRDVRMKGVSFEQGQMIYICPFLTHQAAAVSKSAEEAPATLSFGSGVHVCAGRKIALILAQCFLDARLQQDDLSLDCSGLIFSRDINLVVRRDLEE